MAKSLFVRYSDRDVKDLTRLKELYTGLIAEENAKRRKNIRTIRIYHSRLDKINLELYKRNK